MKLAHELLLRLALKREVKIAEANSEAGAAVGAEARCSAGGPFAAGDMLMRY